MLSVAALAGWHGLWRAGQVRIVQAASQGPINLVSRGAIKAHYHGTAEAVQGLTSRHALPLSLASDDFDVDGVDDLAVGYATPSGGTIAFHRGNLDAFAPQSEASFQAIARGESPSPYLPDAQLVQIPEQPDFLAAGDFIGIDGPGVIAAARGGQTIYVLAPGIGGQMQLVQSISVPGAITALDAHPLLSGKYAHMLAGVRGKNGPELAIYAGSADGLFSTAVFELDADADAFAFGNLDTDYQTDVLILAGGKVAILHGNSQTIDAVALPYTVKAATLGRFLPDRSSIGQMALLSNDGLLHIVAHDAIDSRPLTRDDLQGRTRRSALVPDSSMKQPTARRVAWKEVENHSTGASVGGTGHSPQVLRMRISNNAGDDVMLFGSRRMSVLAHRDERPLTGDLIDRSDLAADAVAAISTRVSVHGRSGVVFLARGDTHPQVIGLAAVILNVNRTDDPAPTSPIANACTGAGSCSLREAVLRANADNAGDTIMVPAGTYTLTRAKIYHDYTGNQGTLEVHGSVNIVGAGAATTIIQAGTSSASTCIGVYPPPNPIPNLIKPNDVNYQVYAPYPNTAACTSVDKIFSFNQDIDASFCSPNNVPTNSPMVINPNSPSSGLPAPALPFTVSNSCVGDVLSNGTVTVSGVTLQNGFNRGNVGGDADGYGGAFDFDTGSAGTATLTLTSVVIQNNTSSIGAGMTFFNFTHPIINQDPTQPTVTISNSTIQNNIAHFADPFFDMHELGELGQGGAFTADVLSRVKMTSTQVLNNTANQVAQGRSGTNTLNTGAGSVGGIEFLGQINGNINAIHSSTISGNTSTSLAGGVYSLGSLIIDTGTTISNNHTVLQGAGLLANQSAAGTSPPRPADTASISKTTFLNNTLVTCTSLNSSGLCSLVPGVSSPLGGGAIIVGNGSGAGPMTIQFSRFIGNSANAGSNIYNTATPVTATDNWWGTNDSPTIAGTISTHNGSIAGTTTFDPFIVLKHSPNPTSMNVGGTSTLTASFLADNHGTAVALANLTVLLGLPITFNNPQHGTLSGAQSSIQSSGTATVTFTGTTVGPGTADAVIDGFTLTSSPVIAVNSPTATAASNQTATYNDANQNVALSATITAVCCAVNGGTVTFKVFNGANQVGGSAVSGTVSGGSATATYVLPGGTNAGTYTIQAVYSGTSTGTGDFLTSSDVSNTHTLVVNKAPTITAVSNTSANFSATNQTVPLSATVTSVDGILNAGTVTFTVFDGSNVQVGAPVTSGTVTAGAASANFTLPGNTPIGTYAVHATYNGSTNFLTSSDNTHTLTVNATTTTTASASSPTFSTTNQNVTLSATVTSAGGTVNAGTVTFSVFNGATQIGSPTSGTVSAGNAAATYVLPGGTSAGTYSIHASFGGSGFFLASSDNTHSLVVNPASTTTTAANASKTFSPSSQTVALSATVSSSTTVNEGTVTFTVKSGGSTVGVPVTSGTVSAGAASANFTLPGGAAAGIYTIQALYNPGADFTGSSDATHTLTVGQATPTVTWNNPADIVFGSALSSAQLNATASVPGTFVYTPPAGTVLPAGSGQTLSVQFAPADATDYTAASKNVSINVTSAPSLATLVMTETLSRDTGTNEVVVMVTLANTGGSAATSVQVGSAAIGSTAATTALPAPVPDVPAGGSSTVLLRFPGSVGTPGTHAVLSVNGTYSSGSFGGSARVTLP